MAEETMTEETMTLDVTRYRPGHDRAPRTQSFTVPYRKDWVVLDALNHIKDRIDGTLSYRWSCRMGVCGSCGMMVNGVPKLTCAAFLRDYRPGPIRVEPLANFPVIRDLVIALDDFMEKLRRVKPWIIRAVEKPVSDGEYLQTPAQLDAYKQFSMCINCMLCYAACPQYGLDPKFTGPGVLALLHLALCYEGARWAALPLASALLLCFAPAFLLLALVVVPETMPGPTRVFARAAALIAPLAIAVFVAWSNAAPARSRTGKWRRSTSAHR